MELSDESRWCSIWLGNFKSALVALSLECLDFGQTLGVLRVEENAAAGSARHRAGVDRLTLHVGGFAHVGAGVLGISVQNVKGHVSKVVCRAETVTGSDGNSVDEPLDAKVGVINWLNAALEVRVLALFDVLQAVERSGEHWLLGHSLNLLLVRASVSLKSFDLLESVLVKSFKLQTRLGCKQNVA